MLVTTVDAVANGNEKPSSFGSNDGVEATGGSQQQGHLLCLEGSQLGPTRSEATSKRLTSQLLAIFQ